MAGVLGHSLVPMHEVLTYQEALEELEPLGLVKNGFVNTSSLPMIAVDDPALLGACVPRPEGVPAAWPIDSVVRITRRSVYTGISTFYRVVSPMPVYPTQRILASLDHEITLLDIEDDEEEETPEVQDEVQEQTVDELMDQTIEFLEQEEAEQ